MSQMQVPELSVILPVYNAEDYISEAVDSVLSQDFESFELIIIDDCSTDSSYEILKKKSESDSRIRLYKNEVNLRLIKTLNLGLSLAKGKYVARMDADDVCRRDRFTKQYSYISKGNVAIVGSNYKVFGTKERLIKLPEDDTSCKLSLLTCSPFCHPVVMMNLDIIKGNGLEYDENYIHAEDFEFFIKLSKCGEVHNIQEQLINYRYHDSQISNVHKNQQIESRVKAILEHYNVDENKLVKSILAMGKDSSAIDTNQFYKGIFELLLYRKEPLSLKSWCDIVLSASKVDLVKYFIKRVLF